MSETHRIDEIERRLIARRAPKPRPTIAEIEAILQRPSDAVSINPDGSVTVGSSADDDIAYLLAELIAAHRERDEMRAALALFRIPSGGFQFCGHWPPDGDLRPFCECDSRKGCERALALSPPAAPAKREETKE
jgi:hypothetical protein